MGIALRMLSLMMGLASFVALRLTRRRSKTLSHQNAVGVPEYPVRATDQPAALQPLSPSPRCSRVSALTKEEADDLLLWLRSTGRMHVETILVPNEGYTIFYY